MSTSTKTNMRIAYLILAHRYPDQLIRLIERLDTHEHTFLIHLDKRMEPSAYNYVVENLKGKSNIFFIKRFACYWAGYGIARATCQGIQEAFERNLTFDYLTLLSGQDYPIKTNDYIKEFLKENKGKSFVNHYPFPFEEWIAENGGWDRIEKWHFIRQTIFTFPKKNQFSKNKFVNTIWNNTLARLPIKRKFPNGLIPFGGAQFWSLHFQHATIIKQYLAVNKNYISFFKYVFVPDEILIQTLVGNLIPEKEVINNTLTYLEWYRKGAVLTSQDLENMMRTDHLYARKFDLIEDATVLDEIDEKILQLNAHTEPQLKS